MSNTITIELAAEDRERIDKLTTALTKLIAQGLPCYVSPEKAAAAVAKAKAPAAVDHPVESPFHELHEADQLPWEETKKPAEEAPKVERADIQRKVVALSGAGKKDQVRDIVKAYADKVSGIPEDKLAEVWAKLTGLEG